MFYDHEVLTNRQYGVATVWLVATLGSRSHVKKITRRAILDVDLPKACQTITEPESPLALRLQGSLLYGVSRVYSQQCGYMLADVTSLRDKMRGSTLLGRGMDLDLDVDVVSARPEQLNLTLDPGFNPDLDLNFDLSVFGFSSDESSLASILSPSTPDSSQSSLLLEESEDHRVALPTYNISEPGTDNHSLHVGQVSSSIGAILSRAGQPSPLEETPVLHDDFLFDVDEDGNMHLFDDAELPNPLEKADLAGDESLVGGSDGIIQEQGPQISTDEYGEQFQRTILFDDDIPVLGYEEPELQPVAGVSQHQVDDINDIQNQSGRNATSSAHEPLESSETAEAPQRRVRVAKPLRPDQRTELSNRDLNGWNQNYLANMAAAIRVKQNLGRADARRYAEHWIFNQGLGRVEDNFPDDRVPHPFAIFSGQSLWDMLTGANIVQRGLKRSRSGSSDASNINDEQRRVRARSSSQTGVAALGAQEELAQAVEDGMILQGDDFNIESEVGRHAPPALQDRSSSMPWNTLHSSRQSSAQPIGSGLTRRSSSVGGLVGGMELGPPSTLGRHNRHLTSASPLHGKGISRLPSIEPQDVSRLTSHEDDFTDLDRQLGADMDDVDFELYGPSATVDTQLAAQSQWVAATLENEAYNFLNFVVTSIQDRLGNQSDVDQIEDGAEDEEASAENRHGERAETPERSITFSQLLPPENNSQVVGAQGLLHVLSLVTKGLLKVYQAQAFGQIEIMVADT